MTTTTNTAIVTAVDRKGCTLAVNGRNTHIAWDKPLSGRRMTMEYETIKHINLSTFTVDGITYTISRPERIVCTDGRTEPLPILNWQAVDADGRFAGNQSIDLVVPPTGIPAVDPPTWGPMDAVADSRAFFNAVEKMRLNGLGATANALAEVGRDPVIKARLIAIAEDGGYPGGLRCAEEAAEQTHEEIQAELRRMG